MASQDRVATFFIELLWDTPSTHNPTKVQQVLVQLRDAWQHRPNVEALMNPSRGFPYYFGLYSRGQGAAREREVGTLRYGGSIQQMRLINSVSLETKYKINLIKNPVLSTVQNLVGDIHSVYCSRHLSVVMSSRMQ